MPERFFAHSLQDRPKEDWQPLREHLEGVGALAAHFAAAFSSEEWGRLAGLWHDLGKYRRQFQRYIDGDFPESSGGDHSVAGARLASDKNGSGLENLALAFPIAGHHGGLANPQTSKHPGPRPLLRRLKDATDNLQEVRELAPPDLVECPLPALPPFLVKFSGSKKDREAPIREGELWMRFLFSALVDADRLDTQRFYEPRSGEARAKDFLPISTLRQRTDDHIDELVRQAKAPDSSVYRARQEVLAACREQAQLEPGLFSLTVPTGGGKTLSALSFALRHAEKHGLRRVITAIPFTSIIEQTAKVYRKALNQKGAADQVIEHHSNLDPESDDSNDPAALRRRWATENWDAPIVVTTNVQLFESLFSNRPSRCRKVHNIARSVLILDEAQTLPQDFMAPILDRLRSLARDYGCTIVLCTATQPALEKRPGFQWGLEGIREIAPDPVHLAATLRRFRAELPSPDDPAVEWKALAERVAQHPRVLTVVHKRGDARDLTEMLAQRGVPGLIHLSASMCAAHRLKVLAEIRQRLESPGAPCCLVSTQLIEAGVDVDFPVVFRALGGWDSLVQAAGRCNREGKEREGLFVAFRAPTKPPPGVPSQGLEAMEMLLKILGPDLDLTNPEQVKQYFHELSRVTQPDFHGIQPLRSKLSFNDISHAFKMIDDGYAAPVAVPWGDGAQRIARLEEEGPSTALLRALQPFLVQVPRYLLRKMVASGTVSHHHEIVYALSESCSHLYDETYGLNLDPDPILPTESLRA